MFGVHDYYFIQYMGEPYSPERGGFVPSFTGGAILDALSISFLADRFGRRITGSIVSDIGCALQGGVVNVAMMIDGRLIAGFSIGLLSALLQCTVPRSRQLRTVESCLILAVHAVRGFFVAQWLGYGCFPSR